MLAFDSLTLQGFLNVKEPETLNLSAAGLTLVIGKNGAGKSARYCEALTWALFGRTIRKLTVNEVINKDSDLASVGLEFRDTQTGEKYLLRRQKNRSSSEALDVVRLSDATTFILGANLAEKQAKLEEWLGMDFRTFTNSTVFGQGLGAFFASSEMSDTDRKKIFDRVYGLDGYDLAWQVTSKKLAEVTAQVTTVDFEYKAVTSSIVTLETFLFDQAHEENAWIAERVTLRVVNVEKVKKAEVAMAESELMVAEAKKAFNEIDGQEKALRRDPEFKALAAEVMESDKLLSEQQEYFNAVLAESTVVLGKIEACDQRIEIFKKALEGTCPTCGQSLAQQDHAKRGLEAVRVERAGLLIEKEEVHGRLKQAKEDYDLHKKLIAEQREKLRVWQEQVNTARLRTDETGRTIFPAEKFHTERVNVWKEAHDTLARFDAEVNPHTALRTRHEKDLTVAKTKLMDVESRRSGVYVEHTILTFWSKAFGPKGIKAFIVESLLPELNRLANDHLLGLTGGGIWVRVEATTALKKGTTAERLSVTVMNEKGAEVYDGNSGGEKRKIDLAILLALQDLVARRAKMGISLSVFDEILDQLDDDSILRAVAYLQTRSKGIPVFLISHNDSARALVDNVVELVA